MRRWFVCRFGLAHVFIFALKPTSKKACCVLETPNTGSGFQGLPKNPLNACLEP